METLLQDFRYSLRMLRHSPGFTLIAVTALALGIGANTAIFSIVNAVLLRSLPFANPDRLVRIYQTLPSKGLPQMELAAPDYWRIRDENNSFVGMAEYSIRDVNIAGSEAPERVWAAFVTTGLPELLGVNPSLGRAFTKDEATFGNHRVAILSHSLWRHNFSGRSNVLGQQMEVNGEKYTVVGVMPPGFEFPDNRTELWAPLPFQPDSPMLTRGNHFMSTIGRLKPGITVAGARADVQTIARRMERDLKENAGMGAEVVSLLEDRVGNVRKALLILLGAVSLVLLIACANVANLLLARAATRQKEISMRAALGAGRWRLVRQFLIESVTLAGVGGALGILLAVWGTRLILSLKPADMPGFEHVSVDGRVLGYALLLSVLTGVVFGLFPALQASRADLGETLKEAGRSNSAGVRRRRFRDALVAAEIAISLVLLIGAGLLIGTLVRLQNVDPGFRPEHVLTLLINLPEPRYPQSVQVLGFYRRLVTGVQGIAGVESASVSSSIPLSDSSWSKLFSLESKPPATLGDAPIVQYRQVSPEYFKTLRIRLLKGRTFEQTDNADRSPVAMINETLARRYFPNEDPIGKRVLPGVPESMIPAGLLPPNYLFPRLTIVGVIGDVKQGSLTDVVTQELYIPQAQNADGPRSLYLTMRVSGDPIQYVGAVREQVRALDKDLPLAEIASMDQLLVRSMSQRRFNMTLLIVFAGLAVVLASVGLYGVIAYSVTQRTQEIGVRMAMGARMGDVLELVLRQGAMIAAGGILAGALAAMGLSRIMASLLFEIAPSDMVTFASACTLLFVIALAACLVPALRAARLDPINALRNQ